MQLLKLSKMTILTVLWDIRIIFKPLSETKRSGNDLLNLLNYKGITSNWATKNLTNFSLPCQISIFVGFNKYSLTITCFNYRYQP